MRMSFFCTLSIDGQVLKEAEAVFGPQDDLPDRSAVDGMRYTLSVLKETLRKYTVVPTVTRRVGVEEESLCGYKIPKQCMVVLSLQVNCTQYVLELLFKSE